VKVIKGEFKGKTGTLIGIDNRDGIVKMEENLDIKLMDISFLAPCASAATTD